MKYKVGDKVRIKSIDWYNENKDKFGNICYKGDGSAYPVFFSKYMSNFCGEILTIKSVFNHSYHMNETSSCEFWTDEMIEGRVEEETKPKYEDEVNGEYYSTPKYLVRPSGYQFVDENGNVINATKIVLEKKKKEYPKTYEECVEILGRSADVTYGYKKYVLHTLQMLLVCRDAYRKIAGEEMGLDKPWEPDYTNTGEKKFSIWVDFGEIKLGGPFTTTQMVLSFPTAKMRDAFYENFKELIEQCKELL